VSNQTYVPLAADVTLTSSNTFYDGPSVTVDPGRWLFVAQVTLLDTAGSGAKFTVRLTDGTTVFTSAESVTHDPDVSSYGHEPITLRLSWAIDPAVETTYKIQAASTVASTGVMRALVPHNGGGKPATMLTASLVLSSVTAALGADVNISTANTYVDGPSVTVGAGTWLLEGHVTLLDTSAASTFTAKLVTGSTNLASGEEASQGSSQPVTIALSTVVTPGSSTTYKISATGTASTNGKIKAATPDNASGNTASTLVATSVASGSTSALSTSVAINTNDVYANGPGLTLTTGVWLLVGQVTFDHGAFLGDFTARLNDGTTTFVAGEAQSQVALEQVNIGLVALVEATASTTYTLQGTAVVAGGFASLREVTAHNAAGNTATRLCAVLVGSVVSSYDAPMLATQCKVLSLWNGSTNVTPPTGWEDVAFNDSGWSTAVSPTFNPAHSYGSVSWSSTRWPDLPLPTSGVAIDPPPGSELVSTTTSTSGNGHVQFLIRWHFTLPDMNFDRVDTSVWTSGIVISGVTSEGSTQAASINGNHFDYVPGNPITSPTIRDDFVNDGANVLAHIVNAGPGTSTGANWVAEMWETLFFRFSNSTGSVLVPPPVPSVRNVWAAVIG
jgi:hypothetical protein